jgi:hypothetical protein
MKYGVGLLTDIYPGNLASLSVESLVWCLIMCRDWILITASPPQDTFHSKTVNIFYVGANDSTNIQLVPQHWGTTNSCPLYQGTKKVLQQ